ncbi:MAG TPA: FecR domain-containing protein [Myxococcales bacterium]|nr:FecR domain-containing protein [Myxococcales bacterium]
MSAPRHKLPGQVAALIAAVLIVAAILFRLAVYEPPRAPRAAAPAAASSHLPVQAVVLSVEGEVERGHEGSAWSAVQPGQTVRADDLLRTGAHGHTDLAIGQKSRLSIGESSEVSVRELSDMVHRFRLTRGRMAAQYDPEGGRVLRVEDGAGDAVAETRAARFSLLSTGTGIAVATASGAVSLSARRQTVEVAAGEQSFALRGAAPAAPSPIPTAVLLKVANAMAGASPTLCAEIDGRAAPSSEVTVDGAPVQLAADGSFHESVPRARGKRSVLVAIRDSAGREKTHAVPCSPLPATIDDMAIRWKEVP